jgi:hypothetical protein
MTGNGNERLTAGVPRTPTGALDHAAIEARARQLRREIVAALLGALARWTACAWARVASPPAAKPRTALSDCRARR